MSIIAFNEDLVVISVSVLLADLDLLSMQPGHEVSRGQLSALGGVEDLCPAATA
jgi:hypothetical protein